MAAVIMDVPLVVISQTTLQPESVAIRGSIIDNYANFTYELEFDNTASSTANEVNWLLNLNDGIRLSNISVLTGDTLYWGRIKRESQAIHEYNQSVQRNLTAALVLKEGDGYRIKFNVENHTSAFMTVFVEGLLTRYRGLYSLSIPITDLTLTRDLEIDMVIDSNIGPVEGYSVSGISGFTVTDVGNGIRIQDSDVGILLPSTVEFKYILERQIGGSELVTFSNGSENFFVYLLAPSANTTDDLPRKHYVFVIDTSGSMGGERMVKTKEAFRSMLAYLNPADLFNIVEFDTSILSCWEEPRPANEYNIGLAQTYVDGLVADHGTNLNSGILEGLDHFIPTSEDKVMLVLSDGVPTSGVTDSGEILSNIAEANTQNVSISTIALGLDADQTLMSNIASQNDGFFTFIDDTSENATTDLLEFYYQFSTPLADDYTISIDGATEVTCLQPLHSTRFFNGSEVMISGRYSGALTIDTTIDYLTGTEVYQNTAPPGNLDNPHVEYIWVQHLINRLIQLVDPLNPNPVLTEWIVNLALDYGLIVAGYTAIILKAYEEEPTTTTTEPTTAPTTGTTTGPSATTTGYTSWTTTPATTTEPTMTTEPATTTPPPVDADMTMVVVAGAVGAAVVLIVGLVVLLKRQHSPS